MTPRKETSLPGEKEAALTRAKGGGLKAWVKRQSASGKAGFTQGPLAQSAQSQQTAKEIRDRSEAHTT